MTPVYMYITIGIIQKFVFEINIISSLEYVDMS